MPFRFIRSLVVCAFLIGAIAAPAAAQIPGPPGQPTVTVSPDSFVTVTFTWPQTGGPVSWFLIRVMMNGAEFPGSPFNISTLTAVTGGPLPAGSYTFSIIAVNPLGQNESFPTSVTVGGGGGANAPGAVTLRQPVVAGSTVTLTWDPPTTGGAPTSYEVEAHIQATGQTIVLPIGNQTSVSVPGVPAGNFFVKIRARNVYGVGPWSTERLVVVGVVLNTGELQVTLTWNTTVDMDLHVIEPDGRHVYYGNKNGTSARLDVDDTNGFGPENIYVGAGQALPGTYQIFLVQYSGSAATTSTVTIRMFPGTSQERLVIITRQTPSGNSSLGYRVADVNVGGGTISETSGTRPSSDVAAAGIKAGSPPK